MARGEFRIVKMNAAGGCGCVQCAAASAPTATSRVPDPPSLDDELRRDRGLPATTGPRYPIAPAEAARAVGAMPTPLPLDATDFPRKEQK